MISAKSIGDVFGGSTIVCRGDRQLAIEEPLNEPLVVFATVPDCRLYLPVTDVCHVRGDTRVMLPV